MPNVFVHGNPANDEERSSILGEAFDTFMLKVPLEQRRFLRKFGFTETEIDAALRDPLSIVWEIRQAHPERAIRG